MKSLLNRLPVLLVLLLLSSGVAVAAEKSVPQRVLFLNSYSAGYAWANDVQRGFRARFETLKPPVSIDTMELNVFRNSSLQAEQAEIHLLRRQLAQVHYDLIVTFGNPASDLFLDGIIQLPAASQLLFCGYIQYQNRDPRLRMSRCTGLFLRHNTLEMIALGQSMFPDVSQVVVITDGGSSGEHICKNINSKAAKLTKPIRITHINGSKFSTGEMLDAIRALPSDALIIFHNWASSKEHLREPLAITLERIVKASPVPVLGRMVTQRKSGMAGGIFAVGKSLGNECAEIALRILDGRSAAEIPVAESASQTIADYEVLQKWGVEEKRLPENTLWLRRPAAFTVRYRQAIIAGGGVALLGCLALIVFLGVRLRYKRLERLIFHSLPLRVTVLDSCGEILFRQWDDGMSDKSKTIRHWRDFPAEVHTPLDAPLADVMRFGGSKMVEFDRDGRRRRAQIQAIPDSIFGKHAVLLSSVDIEELHQERSSKAVLTERFLLTLDSIGDGVIAVNTAGEIQLINPVAAKLLGGTVVTLEGRRLGDVFHLQNPRTRKALTSPVETVLASGMRAEFMPCVDLLDEKNGIRRISVDASPMRHGPGKDNVSGVVLICRDVGKEYERLEQMNVLNELLRSSADIADISYFSCDRSGKFWSRHPQKSFWKLRPDGTPVALGEWIHPDDQELMRQAWTNLYDGRIPEFSIEYRAGEGQQWRYFEMRVRAGTNMITGKPEYIGLIRDIHNAKMAEQQRADSMMLLESVIDNLPSFVSIRDVDHELRYVLCNRSYEQTTGCRWEGKRLQDMMPSPIAESIQELDRNLPAAGEVTEKTISMVDSFGCTRQIKVFRKLLTKADGQRLLLAMNVDITKELKRESELADATLLLQSVMDNLPGYVFVKEIRDGFRYLRGNRMLSDLVGMSSEEIVGLTDDDIFTDDAECKAFHEDDIAALNAPETWSTIRPFTGRDHVRHMGKWFRCVLNRADGERLLLGIVVDITEQTEIHDRLRDANNILQSIMDTIEIPIFLFAADWHLVRTNNAAAPVMRHLPTLEALYQVSGNERTALDGQIHRRNLRIGERDYVSVTAPVINGGKMIYVLCSLIDMSDANMIQRKLAQAVEDARQADKAKSTFLATMSHELRTPLNAVIGFSELLQNSALPEAEQKDYLQSINLAGNALLNLINDVLDLSKIEAEQLEIIPHPTDVGKLLAEIYAIFRQSAMQRKIRLDVKAQENMPMLELDSLRFRQILFNLTGNALKFTHRGFVSVEVRREPDGADSETLICEVRDSGIGIKKEYLTRIFEPFSQQDSLRDSGVYKGTGLGLSISKRLAERMGGSLSVTSEEGMGSVFRFELPRVIVSGAASSVPLSAAPGSGAAAESGGNIRILVVDDVEMNRKVLVAMLRRLGYAADAVGSGALALQHMEADAVPDLLLTDMWMPDMTGKELADRIRQVPAWNQVRIIVITADAEVGLNFDMNHIDGVLLKPVTLERMRNTLKSYSDGMLNGKRCRHFR